MVPPKLERPAGRPRDRQIKSSDEAGKRGPYQCKRCFQFGHIEKTCREPPAELGAELLPLISAKSRKKKGVVASSSSNPSKSRRTSKLSSTPSVRPGPTTRSMTASPSTPISTGPITRRMAAEQAISPEGIARRLIIN